MFHVKLCSLFVCRLIGIWIPKKHLHLSHLFEIALQVYNAAVISMLLNSDSLLPVLLDGSHRYLFPELTGHDRFLPFLCDLTGFASFRYCFT